MQGAFSCNGGIGKSPKKVGKQLEVHCLDTPVELIQKKHPPWNVKKAIGTSRNAGLTLSYLRQLALAWHLQRQHETQDQRPAC